MNTQAFDSRQQTRRPLRQAVRRAADPEGLAAEIRQWIHEVDELGQPRFGELGVLLNSLRQALLRETPSAQSNRSRAALHTLTDQLELLIARLDHGSDHFHSWQDACLQFERLWNERRNA